ncbi:hypothetical protein dsx2_3209 [Desulfovibrio sp. X2]|uniref:hypothetical protein n=1 Tax=Desulfovibrio sp. X2 TaxID=941449 RepID=UPI0003589355|nr:hypothetical protein [Desulfovibrio sp. X2]EPR41456.1 hypothetical protein dsx2_3209 [Desulfovibrio sp. X2]
MKNERRRVPRKTVRGRNAILLDEIVLAEVPNADAAAGAARRIACRIRDVGPEGMRLEMRDDEGAASSLFPGARLRIAQCPSALRELLGGQNAEVVWSRDAECGVRFDVPLRCSLAQWADGAAYVSF